jgi:hypothetical protein
MDSSPMPSPYPIAMSSIHQLLAIAKHSILRQEPTSTKGLLNPVPPTADNDEALLSLGKEARTLKTNALVNSW